MLTHRNLLFSARTTATLRSMTPDDVQYCVLPISHIVGISLLTMTLMVGATVRLVTRYDPAALARAMAEEGITILNGVPATFQRLLEYKRVAGLPELNRGSLRLISRRRRAARSRIEVARRAGIRSAPAQWLRHHGVLPGNFRRASGSAPQGSGRRHLDAWHRSQDRRARRQPVPQTARSASSMSAGPT